ncbi:hypothetical protein K449DRAFT_453278 [Hypoxylon sp. EC38]|nr:hypothetical protein K449DRAFT_453278 [Hypoxylon sp. EC38]
MSSNGNSTNDSVHGALLPSLPDGGSQTSCDATIELPRNTKIIFPPPIRMEIDLPDGSRITLPDGGRITFAGTLYAGGSITLRGGEITSIRSATSIVLGTAAKLTPRAGEKITLPSKVTIDGAGSVHNLPVGTMIFFHPTMPERWRQFPHDNTLPREFTIPPTNILMLSRDVMIPLNTSVLLSENTFFPGGITLPGGVILSSNIKIPTSEEFIRGGTTLADNFYVPQSTLIPGGTSLLGGTILPRGTILRGGTILPKDFTIPEGSVIN